MRKCWYTFILTISLAGAALAHIFPGWVNYIELKTEVSLPESSIVSGGIGGLADDERTVPQKPEEREGLSEGKDAVGSGFPTATEDSASAMTAAPIPDTNFSGVLFIGDSRTVGLSEYGNLGNAEVFANSGMSVYNLFDARVRLRDGSKKSLEQVLSQNRYLTIYLMLGINELGYDQKRTVNQYKSVVSRIQEMQPEAHLILEANLHVTQEISSKSPVYNNGKINALNQEIKKIADTKGCYYIDVNQLFDDENGNLNAAYTSDGSHVLGKYYSIWVEWIRSGK